MDLDSNIDKYQTDVAQFWHAVAPIDWTSFLCKEGVLLRRFYSLLQQMLTVGLSVNFSVEFNVNSFFMTEPNKDNIIQQLFWADNSRTAVSSSAGVSLDTSNQDRREENDPYDRRLYYVYVTCWTIKFLSRHSCLAAARQSRSHSFTVRARLVCCCYAVNRCSF